ncbi:hypothetical protein [Streptomyces winkii]|uniref:hypothetical protein n=1 Tax=Streptomyces winkii TaxID=3051178 RepID=UPI0028D802BE|nr:hypothetical protein [Streptomyces sp. DSM 40971]
MDGAVRAAGPLTRVAIGEGDAIEKGALIAGITESGWTAGSWHAGQRAPCGPFWALAQACSP